MDAQRVTALVWPDLVKMSPDELKALEQELLARLVPSPVYATSTGRPPSRLEGWLEALKPKNAQEAAVVLTAVAALITSAHAVVEDGAPPAPPPAVTVVVEAPAPALAPPPVVQVTDCEPDGRAAP